MNVWDPYRPMTQSPGNPARGLAGSQGREDSSESERSLPPRPHLVTQPRTHRTEGGAGAHWPQDWCPGSIREPPYWLVLSQGWWAFPHLMSY